MNFIENRTLLRELLKQGDAMNTVNGGVRDTTFSSKKHKNGIIIEVSNPSLSSESFNITVDKDQLLIQVMYMNRISNSDQVLMFPTFLRIVKIPDNVATERIEALFEGGMFRIFMPYSAS